MSETRDGMGMVIVGRKSADCHVRGRVAWSDKGEGVAAGARDGFATTSKDRKRPADGATRSDMLCSRC